MAIETTRRTVVTVDTRERYIRSINSSSSCGLTKIRLQLAIYFCLHRESVLLKTLQVGKLSVVGQKGHFLNPGALRTILPFDGNGGYIQRERDKPGKGDVANTLNW